MPRAPRYPISLIIIDYYSWYGTIAAFHVNSLTHIHNERRRRRRVRQRLLTAVRRCRNPGSLGDETLPTVCYPDAKALVDTLKDRGVELMISPYFHQVQASSKNYAEALAKGYLTTDANGT